MKRLLAWTLIGASASLCACRGRSPAPDAGTLSAPPADPIASASAADAGVSEAAVESQNEAVTALLPGELAFPAPPSATNETYPPFRKTTLPIDELARLVMAAPALEHVGAEVSYFAVGDTAYMARSPTNRSERADFTFTTQPLLWSPEAGRQLLVVAARGKVASFVAAWWVLPEGGYRLASSLVMMDDVAPVALVYGRADRTLQWTSCWMCPGETGHLHVHDDHRIVIDQD